MNISDFIFDDRHVTIFFLMDFDYEKKINVSFKIV